MGTVDDLAAAIVRGTPDGLLALDAASRITAWNTTLERLTGHGAADALGRALTEAPPFLREPGLHEAVAEVLAGRPPRISWHRLALPAVHGAPLRAHVGPLHSADGEMLGALVTLRDVADEGHIERRLAETEQRFQVMADCAPVLLWMAGLDALCTFFNQTWLDFTGRTLDEERGVGWAEGVHAEDFQRCMDTYLTAFVAREPFRMEYRLRRADGAYRWILDQGVPRVVPGRGFAGFIGSCIDITELREAHTQLEDMNEALEERTLALVRSNAELEEIAYVAAHDLQEPLRTVVGFVQALKRRYGDSLGEEGGRIVDTATAAAHRMHDLINGLLSYARVERDHAELVPTPLDGPLDQALADLVAAVTDSGAVVTRDALPVVRVDTLLATQLFQNLLGNAVKFRRSERPRVHVGAQRVGERWVVSVADNGMGIPPSELERVFRLFQRVTPKGPQGGTGIGLAVCKRIAERHGGRIWAESEPGRGSTFYVSLPAG